MHKSTSYRRLGSALFGSLAIVIVAGASVAQAAPPDQASPIPDQAVSIDAFAFAPAEVSVQVGATVAWTNVQDGVKHTATSLDGVWDSGVLSTNDAFAFTLNQAGDFAYQCTIHPSMRGIIHVLASADTQAGPAAATDVPTPAPPAAATQPAAANQIPTATPAVAVQIPTATAVAATQIPAATPTPTVNVPATKPTATPAPYEY